MYIVGRFLLVVIMLLVALASAAITGGWEAAVGEYGARGAVAGGYQASGAAGGGPETDPDLAHPADRTGGRPRQNKASRGAAQANTNSPAPVRRKPRADRTKDLRAAPRTKSEQEAIKALEDFTGEKFPTVYPGWLVWRGATLELDGYNEALRIGLEYSGPLHTKWYSAKEPYPAYFERLVRDRAKLALAAREGVALIVVDMAVPSRFVRDYVRSRLADLGRIDRPFNYMPAVVPEPYRNRSIERELGLSSELLDCEDILAYNT